MTLEELREKYPDWGVLPVLFSLSQVHEPQDMKDFYGLGEWMSEMAEKYAFENRGFEEWLCKKVTGGPAAWD